MNKCIPVWPCTRDGTRATCGYCVSSTRLLRRAGAATGARLPRDMASANRQWPHRVHVLRDHFCQADCAVPAGGVFARTGAAGTDTARGQSAPPELRPLSQSQIEQFCRDGHLILHISEVPDEVHARIYEHARIHQKGSVFTTGQRPDEARVAEELLPELTQEQRTIYRQDFAAVVGGPTILGAMHSLLGSDFIGTVDELQGGPPPPRAKEEQHSARQDPKYDQSAEGAPRLPSALVATTGDNQHHKDGTGLPVREHRFRSVGYWYVKLRLVLQSDACIWS